jgi:hypothetical protein
VKFTYILLQRSKKGFSMQGNAEMPRTSLTEEYPIFNERCAADSSKLNIWSYFMNI